MSEENGNGDNNVSKAGKWVKLAVGILTVIAIISGGVWKLTDTFAFKEDVKAVEVEAEEGRQLLAEKSVETFNMFQKTYRNDRRNDNIRFYTLELQESHRRENYINDALRKNPADINLQNRLQEELNLQKLYKQKLDKLLE